jgi:hypothetical protein
MGKWRNVKEAPSGELYVPESQMQISCVKWFRTVYSQYWKHLFSIPNGAKFGGKIGKKGFPIQASIMKAEGMTEDVSDLFLALPRGGFSGFFIEMKTPVGSLRKGQREFLELMASVGFGAACCHRQSDFEKEVTAYMNGTFIQKPSFK